MAGRGNTANLRPFAKGEARARDAGRAGGLRSAVVRAESRALAEWAKQLCDTTASRRGGMTNGEPIVVRAVMKPIPTLMQPLHSVDIAEKKNDLIIEVHGAKLDVKYDKASSADVKMTMKRDVMEDIVSGRMSFQRAFMSGAMTGMQGNFSLLGGLDKVFDFTH